MAELLAGSALLIALACLVLVRRLRRVERRLAFAHQRSDLITVVLETRLLLRAEALPLGALPAVSLSPRCKARIEELLHKAEKVQTELAVQRARLDGLAPPENPGPVDHAELDAVGTRIQELAGDGGWIVDQCRTVQADLEAAAAPY